jgi:Bacterial Ig-like domain
MGSWPGALTVGTALIAVACSSDFGGCEESRNCPATAEGGSGGSGESGDAGQGTVGEGVAGEGAEGGEGGAGDSGGAGPDCEADADCDDAEPKNGVETCDMGACVEGNPPPSVVSVVPADMEVDVAPDGTVTIEFSEEMDPATIANESVKLMDGELSIVGTVTYADQAAVFTAAEPLSLITPYTVVVTTGAADLEGAGMLEDFSASFTVRDGSWGETEAIEDVTVDLGDFDACTGIDGSGNVLVVWNERVGADVANQVSARWYRNGAWEAAIALAKTEIEELYRFSCAVNARGEAIVAWTLDFNDLYARQYRNGAWEPQGLDVDADFPGGPMAVGMSPTGEAHVIWSAIDQLRARQTNATGAWASETDLIATGAAASWYEPARIAFDADGDAFAAWRSWNNSNQDNIRVSRYLASTNTWSVGQVVPGSQSNGTNLKRGVPAIATHEGEAMAAWVSQTSATSFDIVGSRFVGGSWSSTPQVLSIATDKALLSTPPGLVSNGAGFVAAWIQAPYGIDMYRARFVEGTWYSELVDVEADNPPALAGDAHGNLLVVWDSGTGLAYQRYSALTSTWSESAVVGPRSIVANPLLAVASNGTAAAIWTTRATPASGGAPLDIFATLFR